MYTETYKWFEITVENWQYKAFNWGYVIICVDLKELHKNIDKRYKSR